MKSIRLQKKDQLEVLGHWHADPEMILFDKLEGTSTAKIRRTLGLKDAERSSRALGIMVFKKLLPITLLTKREFLAAWWQMAIAPSEKRGVRHCNAFSKTTTYRHFNETVLAASSAQEQVPFMAVNLPSPKVMAGKVKHAYAYDAESFILVLTWVHLQYEGGVRSKNRPLEEFLKVDALR
ncbi:uncharacterized protein F5147DRAFT_810196 [Suillus discolor]|uniref:Uncharacterized protein n=1 Tax=Suillus discolor TaxID=1912936 RepID=A0A9P7F382_9AGAM|nr:uncharacterized protein F5147DRAFT_810196 [Suillus discolor]KAG2102561.1 hypothetical protein F5147DRAFT_810196 [Suillus discolor]